MKRKFIRVAVSLGLAQLALNAAAQDTTYVLKDVVVSATKTAQKQSQSGKVITVIDREQLERSSGKTIAELLGEQAGIIVNGAGSNYGKEKSLFFRGAPSSFAITLIDGIQVGDPSGPGTFDLRSLPIDQIERIEILKGGQSTLYGSDAVAGVINIITRKGGNVPFNVSGIGSFGDYDTYKGNIGLNGRNADFSYNVNFTHLQTGGISEAKSLDPASSDFDKDKFVQDGVNMNLGLNVSQNLRVSPFFRYLYVDSEYDDGGFTDAPNRYFSKHYNSGLNSTYTINKSKFTLNYSYQNTQRQYKSSYPGNYEGILHFADFFYNYSFSPKWEVLAGVDNRFTKIIQQNADVARPETNLFSTYASISATNLFDIVGLEFGGRFNHHNQYGNNSTYSVTPSVSLLNNNLKFFGTVGKAFKAPTLSELFGNSGPNPNLKPQKSDNYEAGFNISLLQKQFNIRVVGYERYLKDAIIYIFEPEGYVNVDKQDDWGLEIEPSFKTSKINISGFYAFVKGRTISSDNSGNPFLKSDVLLRRPKNSFGLSLGYQAGEKLYLSSDFRSYGKRSEIDYDSNFNSRNVLLDAYSLVDVYGQYRITNKLKFFADVKNLFNEQYVEVRGYSTLGTNVNAGLSFSLH